MSQSVGGKKNFSIRVTSLETAAAAAKSLQLCPTLCNPMDYSLPGSSVHGIFQARVLEWGAIAFSAGDCYQTFKQKIIPILCKCDGTGEELLTEKSENMSLTLCNPMDCSLPGSSVRVCFLQARKQEWVAIPFSSLLCAKSYAGKRQASSTQQPAAGLAKERSCPEKSFREHKFQRPSVLGQYVYYISSLLYLH